VTEIYGIAFQSPFLLWTLVPSRKYFPILLINSSHSQIKEDVVTQTKQHEGMKKMPVILATSLPIMQSFIKQFPKMDCKTLLFEVPSFMNPFFDESIKWLDCDHQAGGAWQTAKIKPEDFSQLLDELKPITKSGKEFLLRSLRHKAPDRSNEIESFVQNVPKSYKDLLADLDPESNKSPIKLAKEARKTKDSLKGLMLTCLDSVTDAVTKKTLVELVFNYIGAQVAKREFLTILSDATSEEFIKKEMLTVRKWVDSKSGMLLRDAFFDFYVNKERRAWRSIAETYKKTSEEDILLLVSFFNQKTLRLNEDRVASYQALPVDKTAPVAPNHPELLSVEEIFTF